MRYFFFVATLVILIACGDATPSAETTSITPSPNVTIKIVGGTTPEYRQIREETIPQPNCGGNAEVANDVERDRSIRREIETGSQLAVSATGEVGIAGTGVELGAEVANHLGFSYGVEENISRSLTVKARPGTSMSHIIRLIEVWEVGTAVVIIADEVYEIPFSVRNDFALELKDSVENPCPTPKPNSDNPKDNVENDDTDSELPLVEVTYPQLFFAEGNIPEGTSMKIQVREGEVHAMTAGTICVASVCLPGGTDRGSVVIFLPSANYDVTGLNPTYNWHGAYYAESSQWEIIADKLAGEQRIPGTCSDGDGCSVVDVVIVGPQGIVGQYQE